MGQRKIYFVFCVGFLCCVVSLSYTQEHAPQIADTSLNGQSVYDPFGPENSPDHNGRGSGGGSLHQVLMKILSKHIILESARIIMESNLCSIPPGSSHPG